LNLDADDRRWLDSAVRIARPHLGLTGPSPAAAALVIDPDQRLVGRGITGRGGAPSAVAVALREAGEFAAGATLYTTIEPAEDECDAIAEAQVARAIVGVLDPTTKGQGIDILNAAGIDALLADHPQSRDLHEAYTARIEHHRPLTSLIIAVSRDDMIARRDGLTVDHLCPTSRAWVAHQRSTTDALVTGLHTADLEPLRGADDRAPLRVVLVGTRPPLMPQRGPVLQFAVARRAQSLPQGGPELIEVDGRSGRPDLRVVLGILAGRGINAVHVEAGGKLTEGFIAAEVVDRLHLIRGQSEVGRIGVPATGLGSLEGRLRAAGFIAKTSTDLGGDRLTTYHRGI
jgi:diaminohydroxyphosphoribosylaminopyrimidine deaminase/5-amino-6-(5-phosphoribosylamino)uracil reductase